MLNEVVGHEAAVVQLNSHAGNPRTSYIFHGPEGVGKRYTATALFRQSACKGTKLPDCRCKPCRQVLAGIHPDLRMMEPSGKSYGIALIREMIADACEYPDAAPYKLYVLDRADAMTPEAANAMLKMLEDGPPRSVFVFVTEDESRLINTIRSRSIAIRFSALERETVVKFLSDFDRDMDKVRLCANLSGGSIGVALDYLRGGRLAVRDDALELLLTFHRKPFHQIMGVVDTEESSESLFYLLRYLFADMALIRAGLGDRVANFDKLKQLTTIQATLGDKAVVTGIEKLNLLYTRQPRIKASFPAHLKSTLLQIKRVVRA